MRYTDAREILSEAFEQLDELSPKTYASYINKAAADIGTQTKHNIESERGVFSGEAHRFWSPKLRDSSRRIRNRIRGVDLATAALTPPPKPDAAASEK